MSLDTNKASEPAPEPDPGSAAKTEPDSPRAHPLARMTTPLEPKDPNPGRDWVVFGVTGVISIAFVVWGLIDTPGLSAVSAGTKDAAIKGLGWFFVLAASFFVIYVLWLAASKYGRIPLGCDDEQPEFR